MKKEKQSKKDGIGTTAPVKVSELGINGSESLSDAYNVPEERAKEIAETINMAVSTYYDITIPVAEKERKKSEGVVITRKYKSILYEVYTKTQHVSNFITAFAKDVTINNINEAMFITAYCTVLSIKALEFDRSLTNDIKKYIHK